MIGEIFNILLLRPVLNALLLLYSVLGHNFALAIAVLTIILRLVTQPLMASQMKMSKKMAELQPLLKEAEKKYGNDKERMAQEQMKLYKQHGVNPMGGCLPMLAQFPLWIALYQSIMHVLGRTPVQLVELAKYIYSFGPFAKLSLLIPLASQFLWLDLGRPDPFYIVPILTAATMWVQQKMMTPASGGGENAQQAQMSQMMQMMMPAMFFVFMLNLSSGLGLYFVISNLVGIVMQYFTTGWGGLASLLPQRATALAEPAASVQKGTRSGSRKKKR